MISTAIKLVFAALLLASVGGAAAETPRDPAQLELEPLNFVMPQAVERRLDNGIRVLVFENHELPLVTLSARMAMGRYFVPVEQVTAVELLSRLWDEGGAGDYGPARLDSLVEAMGMTLRAWAGDQVGGVVAYMAREDLDRGAELWRELLLRPVFDPDRLQRAKARKIKDLQSINDDPKGLAETWFWRLLAGPESVEGRVADRTEIEAGTREDLLALHRRFVVPQNTVVGVAGDITPEQAVALLGSLLGDWTGPDPFTAPQVRAPRRQARPGVFVLPGDFKQCHIRIGRNLPGLTDRSPDFAAVKIADFGVGFLRVYYRTRLDGLSYGTGSRLLADRFQGTCMALGSTRPEKVVALLDAVMEEVAGVGKRPLTEEEVETARTFQLGAFIQQLETDRDVIDLRLKEITLGLPDGYYQGLFSRQQQVNADEVASVTRRWCGFGDNPVVLVVGTPEGGAEALAELGLGPVQILETEDFGK